MINKTSIALYSLLFLFACHNGEKPADENISTKYKITAQTYWIPYTDNNYGFSMLVPRTDTTSADVKNKMASALAWLKPSCGDDENCPLITSLDEDGFFLFIHPAGKTNAFAGLQKQYETDPYSDKHMKDLQTGKFPDGTPYLSFTTHICWDSLYSSKYNKADFIGSVDASVPDSLTRNVKVVYFNHKDNLFRYFYDLHNPHGVNIAASMKLF